MSGTPRALVTNQVDPAEAERLEQQLASHLSQLGISGVLGSNETKTVINSHAVPTVETWIRESIQPYSSVDLEFAVGRELNRTSHAHLNRLNTSQRGVSLEVQEHSLGDVTRSSQTTQALLEFIHRNPPEGTRRPGDAILPTLLAMSEVLVSWSWLSEKIHFGLSAPRLEIQSGKAILHEDETIVRFSKSNMQLARWRHENELNDSHLGFIGEYALSVAEQREGTPADEEIDQAFNDTFGYSLRALIQILMDLPRVWSQPTLRRPAYVQRQLERRDQPPAWWDALRSLVLPRSVGTGENWTAARMNASPYRLSSHPIVELADGRWLIMPAVVARASLVYATHLTEGTWPRNSDELDGTPLGNLLLEQERRMNSALESEVLEALVESGYSAVKSVKTAQSIGVISSDFPGEIDVICIDVSRARIWVIEVKDLRQINTLRHVSMQLGKWWGHADYPKASFASKLLRKVEFVRAHADAVATSIVDTDSLGTNWDVRGLFVTREPSIAGVYVERPFPITWLSHLGSRIRS